MRNVVLWMSLGLSSNVWPGKRAKKLDQERSAWTHSTTRRGHRSRHARTQSPGINHDVEAPNRSNCITVGTAASKSTHQPTAMNRSHFYHGRATRILQSLAADEELEVDPRLSSHCRYINWVETPKGTIRWALSETTLDHSKIVTSGRTRDRVMDVIFNGMRRTSRFLLTESL